MTSRMPEAGPESLKEPLEFVWLELLRVGIWIVIRM